MAYWLNMLIIFDGGGGKRSSDDLKFYIHRILSVETTHNGWTIHNSFNGLIRVYRPNI